VQGSLEGRTLVGTVRLCQKGPGCEPWKRYALFGFLDEKKGLVAQVRMESGCASPGLENGWIVMPALKGRGYVLQARWMVGEGRFAEAKHLLRQAILERDDLGAAYEGLALVSLKQNDGRNVLPNLERAVDSGFKDPDLLRQEFDLALRHHAQWASLLKRAAANKGSASSRTAEAH
jgi:hypothetical protein